MKNTSFLSLFTITLLFVGCSPSARPIASGMAVSGTVWEHPLSYTANNSGNGIPNDARVEVYEHLIVIHRADGTHQVVAPEFVSDLRLK